MKQYLQVSLEFRSSLNFYIIGKMSVLNHMPRVTYVPHVPTCFTFLCALHADVPLHRTCLHFFPCLTCPYISYIFFTCLHFI